MGISTPSLDHEALYSPSSSLTTVTLCEGSNLKSIGVVDQRDAFSDIHGNEHKALRQILIFSAQNERTNSNSLGVAIKPTGRSVSE